MSHIKTKACGSLQQIKPLLATDTILCAPLDNHFLEGLLKAVSFNPAEASGSNSQLTAP